MTATWHVLEIAVPSTDIDALEIGGERLADLDLVVVRDGDRVRVECAIWADTLAEAIEATRLVLDGIGLGDLEMRKVRAWDADRLPPDAASAPHGATRTRRSRYLTG